MRDSRIHYIYSNFLTELEQFFFSLLGSESILLMNVLMVFFQQFKYINIVVVVVVVVYGNQNYSNNE